MAKYKALKPCTAGGFFRNEGEVFSMARLEKVPSHLKELDAPPVKTELPNLSKMNRAELTSYAGDNGIDISQGETNKEIIAIIEKAKQ